MYLQYGIFYLFVYKNVTFRYDFVCHSKSAYRPWRRPKLTADIQPLRKIFEENPKDLIVPPPGTPPAELTASTSNLYLPMLVKTARLATQWFSVIRCCSAVKILNLAQSFISSSNTLVFQYFIFIRHLEYG